MGILRVKTQRDEIQRENIKKIKGRGKEDRKRKEFKTKA